MPETLLSRLGLSALAVDGNESSAFNVLSGEQAQKLMSELDGAEGVKLLSQSGILTLSGRRAEVQAVDDHAPGGNNNFNHTIDLLPVISSDKTTVEITLDAGLTKPGGKTN